MSNLEKINYSRTKKNEHRIIEIKKRKDYNVKRVRDRKRERGRERHTQTDKQTDR